MSAIALGCWRAPISHGRRLPRAIRNALVCRPDTRPAHLRTGHGRDLVAVGALRRGDHLAQDACSRRCVCSWQRRSPLPPSRSSLRASASEAYGRRKRRISHSPGFGASAWSARSRPRTKPSSTVSRLSLLLGGTGLVTCVTFVWLSAPDLAVTQLVVEIVTTVLILLGLRWLPKRSRGLIEPSGLLPRPAPVPRPVARGRGRRWA